METAKAKAKTSSRASSPTAAKPASTDAKAAPAKLKAEESVKKNDKKESSPQSTLQYLWSVFIKCPFDDYSAPELVVRRRLFIADAFWIPLSLLLYYGLGGFALWTTSGHSVPDYSMPPSWISQLLLVFAALSMYVLYLHIFATPSPTKDASVPDFVGMDGIFGRWWFLTRQTIGLQFWHQTVSAVAVFSESSSMNHCSHAVALFLCGPALFVTVQFFALVAPHPDFKATCDNWRQKGVPFCEVMYLLHIPQLPMALLDVIALKNRSMMLKLTPNAWWMTTIFAAFVAYYLSLVAINFLLTGQLPYGVMRDCGSSRKLWAMLILKQLGVLMVLFVPACVAANFLPAVW